MPVSEIQSQQKVSMYLQIASVAETHLADND
jgi:hypothetical protein